MRQDKEKLWLVNVNTVGQVHMVVDALIAQQRSTNILEMIQSVNIVGQVHTVVGALIVQQRNTGMAVVGINASGVSLLQLAVGVLIAQPNVTKNRRQKVSPNKAN